MTSKTAVATHSKLLDAACDAIRGQGYTATTVDDICARAGVSKGSFFHHFRTKEDLGLATVHQFGQMADHLFESAPYTTLDDPRERVFAYLDFRLALLSDDIVQFTCLLGTTVQEVHATHPPLRDACNAELTTHIDMLARELDLAKTLYAPGAEWTPQSVAAFMQSVLQGAFIFAKARQSSAIVAECLAHLRSYLEQLLGSPRPQQKKAHRRRSEATKAQSTRAKRARV
jgi:TetR/AcrR family transcriptional repressor of nem operon